MKIILKTKTESLLGFDFHIAHFLFSNGDIAHATSFVVYISQLFNFWGSWKIFSFIIYIFRFCRLVRLWFSYCTFSVFKWRCCSFYIIWFIFLSFCLLLRIMKIIIFYSIYFVFFFFFFCFFCLLLWIMKIILKIITESMFSYCTFSLFEWRCCSCYII